MRTIKFRGKSIYGEWAYGSLVKLDIGFIILTNNKTELDKTLDNNNAIVFSLDDISVVIPETVGQFTGLLDKNGKEIYEGDIIGREHNEIKVAAYVIEYIEGGLYARSVISGAIFQMSIKSAANDRYYIIGNLHDNPELLKGDKE